MGDGGGGMGRGRTNTVSQSQFLFVPILASLVKFPHSYIRTSKHFIGALLRSFLSNRTCTEIFVKLHLLVVYLIET